MDNKKRPIDKHQGSQNNKKKSTDNISARRFVDHDLALTDGTDLQEKETLIEKVANKHGNKKDEIFWSRLVTGSPEHVAVTGGNDPILKRKLISLKLDPIASLEKKYNINFVLNAQTPSKKISRAKTMPNANFSGSSSKTRSLGDLSKGKLFSNIAQPKNSSLSQMLNELNKEDDLDVGNTTSELLDKGISLDDYKREDFEEWFFDEESNDATPNKLKEPLKNITMEPLKELSKRLEANLVLSETNYLDSSTPMKTQDPVLSKQFTPAVKSVNPASLQIPIVLDEDEFSSDEDDFNELQKKIDQRVSQTTERLLRVMDASVDISIEDSLDSLDEDEENKLLSRLNKTELSTQQLKIQQSDIKGAAVFLKGITDETLEPSNYKDSFSDVNMARIAISRPWLHRFEIVQVTENSYSVKGRKKNQLILKVKDAEDKLRNVVVRDQWLNCSYDVGEILHVIGDNPTVVDGSQNLLVLNPDTLISATSLGESLNCERKSALQARYNFPGESSIYLIIGNLIHELLQLCLVEKRNDDIFIYQCLDMLMDRLIIEIFSINETKQSVLKQCEVHIQYVKIWIDKYIFHNNQFISTSGQTRGTKFSVSKTLDIEESIWSPIYGLRGLLDATIEASINGKFVAPLEIKTGMAYISHKAQASLYTLLVKDRYEMDVKFFVLLYTKLKETTRHEIDRRDLTLLMIKRNNLSKYLKQILAELPPVLKSSVCDRCYLKQVCMTYNKLVEDGTEEGSGFAAGEFELITSHLSDTDSQYYKYWEQLINQEENFIGKLTKELWLFTGQQRESSNGKSISSLMIRSFTEDSGEYTYTFERRESHETYSPMNWTQISKFDHVLVSDEKGHFAISSGFISAISANSVLIRTRRRLDNTTKLPNFNPKTNQIFQSMVESQPASIEILSNRIYRLDKNPAFHGLQVARYNLLELFLSDGNKHLRDILVFKKRKPPAAKPYFQYTIDDTQFNPDQIKAINNCFTTNDFSLILGMPGTGKTTTITEILKILVANHKSVLVVSYTHSAIDNILIKLKLQNITDFIRLGALNRIHDSIKQFSPLSELFKISEPSELRRIYLETSIVATTCLGIRDWLFSQRRFDYCIVDEASQVSMPICIGPLNFCERFVLVGDHYQLPPLIVAPSARKGLQKSLFKSLSEDFPESVNDLSYQYRMCEEIMTLSNVLIYNGRLKCGNRKVARKVLTIPHPEKLALHLTDGGTPWMENVLNPENRVMFLNHDNLRAGERMLGDNVDNPVEADLIFQIVEAMVATGVDETSIGVMSIYRAQIRLLKSKLHLRPNLDVMTADKFQGLDKNCIIISLVRSNDKQVTGELLREWRRINVAITRAKCKLIILGSRRTLKHLAILEAFMNIVESRGWSYELPAAADTSYEFSFQSQPPGPRQKTAVKLSQSLLNKHLLLQDIFNEES